MDKKNMVKIIGIAIAVLWVALGVLNYFEVQNLKLPSMAWPGATSENGESITYFGAGYSFVIEGDIDEQGRADNIEKIEMFALGFRIASKEAK